MFEYQGNPDNLISHMVSKEQNINHIEHIYDFNSLAHQIALEEINRVVPELCIRICSSAMDQIISGVFRAFEYDINTVYEISFNDLEAMFRSQKARKFMSDAVLKEVKKGLNNIRLDIKF